VKKIAYRAAVVWFLMSGVFFATGLQGLYLQPEKFEMPAVEERDANQNKESQATSAKQKSSKNTNKLYRPTPTSKPTPTLESRIMAYGGFSFSAICAICGVVTVVLMLVQIRLARKSRY
jgi:cytoskeletal protein RodZ